MISSRAISISRRKINLLLIMFCLLLASLEGAELRVAYYTDNPDYQLLLEDVLNLFDGKVTSPESIALVEERENKEALRDYDIQVDKYYQAESFDKLEKLTKPEAVKLEDISLSIVDVKLDEKEKSYLLSGNQEAFDYIREKNSLDILIVVAEEASDPVPHMVLYINGEVVRESLFNLSMWDDELDALVGIFFPIFKSDNDYIFNIGIPSSFTLYVDGKQIPSETGYIVLERGKHTISYVAPGFLPKVVEVVADDDFDAIKLDLEQIVPLPLYLRPVPYDSIIYYNGILAEDHIVDDALYPFTVTAYRDGFSTYSMQSTERMNELYIEMKPAWMEEVNLLEMGKEDFYSSLFGTLIAFGSSIAMNSVARLYPDVDMAPVAVALSGISLVSLINMLDSAIDYFQAAKLGI